jgi:hypothetical protein
MDAGVPIELLVSALVERRPAICPIRAAAVRVIARTRAAWAAEDAVSAAPAARPRRELKGSRALDNQPWTGD